MTHVETRKPETAETKHNSNGSLDLPTVDLEEYRLVKRESIHWKSEDSGKEV